MLSDNQVNWSFSDVISVLHSLSEQKCQYKNDLELVFGLQRDCEHFLIRSKVQNVKW